MRYTDGPAPVWEILPGQLYQRGKLHDYDINRKVEFLQHYGVTQAYALAPTRPDPHLDTFIDYTHHAIPDGLLHEAPLLHEFAARAASEISRGGVVLTMCNAGRNRSGLLSALTMYELGMPAESLVDHVRQERPNALANDHFVDYLQSLVS